MRAPSDYVKDLIKAKQAALDYEAWKVLRGASTKWALVGPVQCNYTTSKAILVRLSGEDDAGLGTWIPRSQLHPEENEINEQGDVGMLVIPEWLAKEKGWL